MREKARAYPIVIGVLLLAQATSGPPSAASSHSSSGASNSASSSHSTASSAKTIHVSGYFRANGTYVQDYYRSPPGIQRLDQSDFPRS
jgi:hypothetical protein